MAFLAKIGTWLMAPTITNEQRPLTTNNPTYVNPQVPVSAVQNVDMSGLYPVHLWDPNKGDFHADDASVPQLHNNAGFEKKQVAVGSRQDPYGSIGKTNIDLRMVTSSNLDAVPTFDTSGFEFDSLSEMNREEMKNFHELLRRFVESSNRLSAWEEEEKALEKLYPILDRIAKDFGERNGLVLRRQGDAPLAVIERGSYRDQETGIHFDSPQEDGSDIMRLWIPVSDSPDDGRIDNLCLGVGDMTGLGNPFTHIRGSNNNDMTPQAVSHTKWYQEERCGAVWFRATVPHFSNQRNDKPRMRRTAVSLSFDVVMQ